MPLKPRPVLLPYKPRAAFMPFHERAQRWACMVCHRRAGKTVAAINDLIKRAMMTPAVPGRMSHFAYIAPYRAQAKSVAWAYLKYYAEPLIKDISESDLYVILKGGQKIQLFGADNADAMRGLGFDGVFMDEYGDFRPSVWALVIRPTLSDRMGWAVFAGTPKGKNQFWEVFDQAVADPERWFSFRLKASESGILHADELEDARRTSSEDQFLQEYECSFDAAILGAFYGTEMRLLDEQGRITEVAYDPALPTFTAWDLGYRDDTAIWWYQTFRGELRIIDFYAVSGASVPDLVKVVKAKPYHYEQHFLPHDARAKTLASNKSIIEQLSEHFGLSMLSIVPNLGLQDGIQAARITLPLCWFDMVKCKDGVEALRQYEREYDEDKKAFRATPKHNWASHPADAFRMLAVSWREHQPQNRTFPERALIAGPQNKATLNDMWAAAKSRQSTHRL